MASPLISIITVVYNGAATMEAAISSVLNQTYNNIEFIVVDGGSTDGTTAILEKYSSKIKWQSEADKGIYDAMNKGVGRATGDWLYFLGCDDILYNNQVIERVFSDNENLTYDFLYGNVYSEGLKAQYGGEFSLERMLFRNMSHQAIFYKKTVFSKLGIYNVRYKLFADWDFNMRCYWDETIKRRFVNITIAKFGGEGASTQHEDVLFLKEIVLPKVVDMLKLEGPSWLFNIGRYDKCWRLVRSINAKSINEQNDGAYYQPMPYPIKLIINAQNRISTSLLRNGLVSKFAMSLSYCFNLIKSIFS